LQVPVPLVCLPGCFISWRCSTEQSCACTALSHDDLLLDTLISSLFDYLWCICSCPVADLSVWFMFWYYAWLWWSVSRAGDALMIISSLWASVCFSLWFNGAQPVLFVLHTGLACGCWCLSKHQWMLAMIHWIICKIQCINNLPVSFICLFLIA
jgi:hypothetical protein